MKQLGYAGRRPEKANKHEAWPGVHLPAGTVVLNGSIKRAPEKKP